MVNICIVGGGFGGLYTALSLSYQLGKEYKITLVEQNEYFSFTPLLYELITDELQAWQIAPSYAELLQGKKIERVQATVENVDLRTRQVNLKGGEILKYNYLVLAVGSQSRIKDIPGASDQIMTFRNFSDVSLLLKRLDLLEKTQRNPLHIAVVGGGPSGVESACKLADRLACRGEVSLITRSDNLLKSYSKEFRRLSIQAIYRRKISLYLSTSLNSSTSNRLSLIYNKQTIELKTDLVLWAVGSQMRDWILELDCQHGTTGKLLTRKTLQLLDYPEVFAVGDIAEINTYSGLLPTTAQVAYQEAFCVASNLIALVKGRNLKQFKYLHLGDMLTLGKGQALVSSFGLNIGGNLGGLIRQWVYLFRLPTSGHRLKVFKSWFRSSYGDS